MDCPRCGKALINDRCPDGCGGLVPATMIPGKAQKLLVKADRSLPSFPCPVCGQSMELCHPKGLDVEVCHCGALWLDTGEEKLVRRRAGTEAGLVGLEGLFWLGWLFS